MAKIRFKALFACLLLLSTSASQSSDWSFSGAASQTWAFLTRPKVLLTALAAVSFGFHRLCKYISTPNNPKEITLEMLQVTTLIRDQKDLRKIHHIPGIADCATNKEVIVLYCPGYLSGETNASQKFSNTCMKAGVIPPEFPMIKNQQNPLPCISFEFLDNINSFNFGQDLDQRCFNLVYQAVVAKNPNAKIIVYGMCRGGLVAYNSLCNMAEDKPNQYQNIHALVLDELPNTDIKEIPYYVTQKYYLYPSLYHRVFANIKKNYNQHPAKKFPAHIPVFVSSLVGDRTCSEIRATVRKLKEQGCVNLYYSTYFNNKLEHGHLIDDQNYTKNVNLFYKKFNLPYYPEGIDPMATGEEIEQFRVH